MKLLSTSYKIEKSNNSGLGYLTKIQYLLPHKLSSYNVCSSSTIGCRSSCLNLSGMGVFNSVQKCRMERTKLLFENRDLYKKLIYKELESHIKKSQRLGLKPAIRMNGTSDLMWESIIPDIFNYPIQYYEYTKIYNRMIKYLNNKLPKNLHLTFSRSENNEDKCFNILKLGGNTAFVFKNIPKFYKNFKIFSGDNTDLRFLDPTPSIIGLKAKGLARKDATGFVIN